MGFEVLSEAVDNTQTENREKGTVVIRKVASIASDRLLAPCYSDTPPP